MGMFERMSFESSVYPKKRRNSKKGDHGVVCLINVLMHMHDYFCLHSFAKTSINDA